MDLASSYDAIVLGTGLVESLLAAAAAMSGKSVLQLDAQDYYGGRWATLSMSAFLGALRPGGGAGATGLEVVGSTDPACIGESRAFLVDLAPRLVYGAGPMVDALLASGAHHYTEFKLLQNSYLLHPGNPQSLQGVPSTRADVFASRDLSLADKRVLMRFLQRFSSLLPDGGKSHASDPSTPTEPLPATPFGDFMTGAGLVRPDLRATIAHGVLLLPDPALSTTGDALERLALIQRSVGRYGEGSAALLCPMHGAGELAQAFCRSAAVGGAVQMLRCPVVALRLEGVGGSWDGEGAGTVVADAGPTTQSPKLACTGICLGAGTAGQEIAAGVVIGGPAEVAAAMRSREDTGDVAPGATRSGGKGAEGEEIGAAQPSRTDTVAVAPVPEQPRSTALQVACSGPGRTCSPGVLRCVAVLDAARLIPGQGRICVTLPGQDGRVVWMLALGHELSVCPANR